MNLHALSYYAATAKPAPRRPTLAGDLRCDVCVVGAGYTGLSAALHLAERGYSVVVLEGRRVGWGASGRNGGQIVTGFAADNATIERQIGREDARRLWDTSEEAKQLLAERVRRHAIECDLTWGYLYAAHKPRHVTDLRATATAWAERYGYAATRMVERDELPSLLRSPCYVGGMIDDGSGHLHPLNYALGLAKAVEAAGARLFEASPVRRLDPGLAITPRGSVHCQHVVLCGNAYLGQLLPAATARLMPVETHMVATAPLPEEVAEALIARRRAVSDCNHILDYYRLSADHRLLFGGGATYWRGNLDHTAMLRQRLETVFPQLAGIPFDYTWSGHVAITASRLPWFGRIEPRTWFATGFSGHGVALTGLAGKLMAEAIAGTSERFDLFARLHHQSFPGAGMRAPLLALVMGWYRLRDLL